MQHAWDIFHRLEISIMTNLDELLGSLLNTANSELESLPLISADTFPEFGDIYVGCYAKWLFDNGYLVQSETLQSSGSILRSSPSSFSRNILEGKLFAKDINIEAREFSVEYIRNNNLFLDDFSEVNIVRKNKSIGDTIPDDEATYKSIAELISRRFELYKRHDVGWAVKSAHYYEVDLSDTEKTEMGWIDSLSQLQLTASTSEKNRLASLNKMWALIDFSPNIGTEKILFKLLDLTRIDLGDGVLESIRNAIGDFSFSMAIRGIFNDSVRLEQSGLLGQLLSKWSELNNQQAIELDNEFDQLTSEQKSAVLSAVRIGLRNADAWARRWDSDLSD